MFTVILTSKADILSSHEGHYATSLLWTKQYFSLPEFLIGNFKKSENTLIFNIFDTIGFISLQVHPARRDGKGCLVPRLASR